MTSQLPAGEGSVGDPGTTQVDAMFAAVAALTQRVESIDASLRARASEADALPPVIERVVSRVGEIREGLLDVHPRLERATEEIQSLSRQQDAGAESLLDLDRRFAESHQHQEALSQAFAVLQRRFDDEPRGDHGALQSALDRIAQIEQRLDTLAQIQQSAASATSPELANRTEQLEQRLDALTPPNESTASTEPNRLDEIEERLEALSQIITLIVERSRLIAEDDLPRDRARGRLQSRRGSERGGRGG